VRNLERKKDIQNRWGECHL